MQHPRPTSSAPRISRATCCCGHRTGRRDTEQFPPHRTLHWTVPLCVLCGPRVRCQGKRPTRFLLQTTEDSIWVVNTYEAGVSQNRSRLCVGLALSSANCSQFPKGNPCPSTSLPRLGTLSASTFPGGEFSSRRTQGLESELFSEAACSSGKGFC